MNTLYSSEHLVIVAGCAKTAQFNAAQVLFQEGETANQFYLSESGWRSIRQSKESVLALANLD